LIKKFLKIPEVNPGNIRLFESTLLLTSEYFL
jgi:hypothetical protein